MNVEEAMLKVLNMSALNAKNIKDLEGYMTYKAWLSMGGREFEDAPLNQGMVHFCGDKAEWFE